MPSQLPRSAQEGLQWLLALSRCACGPRSVMKPGYTRLAGAFFGPNATRLQGACTEADFQRCCRALPHGDVVKIQMALARLSHLEGIRTHKCNGMSKGYPKVFTTKRELNYRKRGASTGSGDRTAVTGLLILGGGWAGNSMPRVSSRICTSSEGCVYRGSTSHRLSLVGIHTSII
jgi:hypothetical protein